MKQIPQLIVVCCLSIIQSEWCKTDQQAPLEAVEDTSKGGADWGYCKERGSKPSTTDQEITIHTIEGLGLKGQMHVMLIGDSTTETFVLNSNGPINNPVEKFEITSQANVGDVWSIELSILENSGEKQLFKELEVKKGIFKQVFRPQAFLAEDKTQVLEATGSRDWKLHVKKLQNKTCSGLLRIRLTGSVRRSQWVIFAHKGLSPTEKAFEFPINTTDVGKIETVEFSRLTDEADASSECEITELQIEKLPLKKLAFHQKITEPILSLKVLKIRLEKELIMSNVDSDDDEGTRTLANEVADEGVASAPSLKGEVPLEDLEYKKKSSLKESESLNISEKFQQVQDGSQCYSNDTLSQVVTFDDCEATLDAVEHFDIQQTGILQVFQGKKSVLVRCTKPCFQDKQDESKDIINKKVRGITLHPLKENPCRAAYVDRAMPRQGGLIQVSLAPGSATDIPIKPLGYTGQMFIKNVEIDPVGASDMYQQVTPVDNIDRISNLVRILDNEGRLATKGFLEVNIEGEWVAACQMSHKAVPRMACQALGFEQGEVLKERDEDKVFISTFNKKFRQKAPRKNIMCGNTPKTLDDCFLFEEAKCQDPAADLFLRCTNFQPFSSLKDKTEIGKLNESGETELHVKFVHEKTENEEVVQDDLDYCLPTTLDNNIITALNTLCHYKQFKNYAGVQGEPLEKPTCWDISSCQDCGQDVVDNIVKTLKNADQNTKKLVLRCGERADIAKPEPLSGQIRSDVPPVKSLDCSDTLKTLEVEDKQALGQPGASFLVYCPAECASMSDKKVSGSSYFTEDTSICAAALQRDLESNLLQLTIGQPMVVFKENLENNGVSSQPADLNASPDKKFSVSFTVTEYTPCLLAAVNDELIVNPKQPDATSFFQIKSNLTSRLKNAHQKRVQNKVKLLSFIQLGADGPEAATLGQQWYWNQFFGSIPKSQYYSEKQEGLNSVNTNVQPNFSKEQWTLFFGQRMMDRPPNGGKANVLRLDGPVGVAIVVKTADNLTTMVLQTFTDGIVDKSYKLTFQVDENQATVDYQTLIFKDKTLSAIKNGKHATIPEFTLGSVAQVNSNQAEDKLQFLVDASFSGWVRQLAFFESALDQNVLKDLSSKVELFKPPEKKTVSDVTTDDRMCKSECSSDPVPVSGNNAGKAEAAELNSRVEVEVVQNEKSDRTCQDSGSEFVQCRLNMNDMSAMAEDFPDFLEHQTQRICCHSSSSCESGWQALELAEANEDYGFKINPPGNSVCQAARRENLLMPGQITEVFFTITKIPVNNVEKKAALGFRVSAAPPLPLLSCYETLDQNEKLFGGKNGKKQGLQCPKGCFTRYKSKPVEKAPMAGNSEIGYSEDSAVCYAALHAGLLSDSYPRELNIEIKSESAPIRFECGATCDAFGVRAGSRRWQRGFKFVETNLKCRTIKYKMDERTLFTDFRQSKNATDDDPATQALWAVQDSPVFNRHVLLNERKMSGSPMHSFLVLDNSECLNGRVSVNLYFTENLTGNKFAALIFRQQHIGDEENFQFVRFTTTKVSLMIMKAGVSLEIQSAPGRFLKNTVQSLTVLTETSTIEVFVQSGVERQRFRQLKVTDNQITRGRVGLGVNDSDKVQFDSLETGDPVLPFQKDYKDFDQCLSPRNEGDRKKYCDPIACPNVLSYCTYCCSQLFNQFEVTDRYNCKSECLKIDFPDEIQKREEQERIKLEKEASLEKDNTNKEVPTNQ